MVFITSINVLYTSGGNILEKDWHAVCVSWHLQVNRCVYFCSRSSLWS